MSRQLPRWSDLRLLLGVRRPSSSATERRLSSAADIWDLRRIARRRTPRSVFDYTDGAAESESTLQRSRAAYRRVEFHPRVLQGAGDADTSTTILGQRAELPLVFAPTGFTRMMHHTGEPAVARVAARLGIPYALSTLGTTTPEDLVSAAPRADLWFQLYVQRDRGAAQSLLDRVSECGYRVLVLTVDAAVAGNRLRDVRNGLTVPPTLTVKTLVDMAGHPAWWWNVLTTEPLEFASMRQTGGTVADLVDAMFDPEITYDDVSWLREQWPGKLVVKGIQSVADAQEAVRRGADGLVVSNHGGRQLDRAAAPLEMLPGIVEAVGSEAEVFVDGGIMAGGDIAAAVALGARAALVGRAYLYGLMAGGERGVQRAVDFLAGDYRRTLQMLGVPSTAALSADNVTLRRNE